MPCLSGQFNPDIGILINVVVLPPGLITPGMHISTPLTPFPALVDTGASMTCISPQVVQAVGLQPMGMHSMVSATHTVPVNVYLVDLLLPFGSAGLFQAGVQVMEFASGPGQAFQMLLGRDILCRGTFTMSFDGHLTFSL